MDREIEGETLLQSVSHQIEDLPWRTPLKLRVGDTKF